MRFGNVIAIGSLGLVLAAVGWLAKRDARAPVLCPEGMVQLGSRCCGEGQHVEGGACRGEPQSCSRAQRVTSEGCVPRTARVRIEAGRVNRRPTDWDAKSVDSEPLVVDAFDIDSHEVTEAEYLECVRAHVVAEAPRRGEPGLPQTTVSADAASACCTFRGGTLPTSDQLAFAAMGPAGRRYPWGDGGAVCRRVAHGLVDGPCGHQATGPQLAGTHPSGASPEGVFDLAGNVEEWSRSATGFEARGGSFEDSSVTALRTFNARSPSGDDVHEARGFRCVYAASAR